MSDDTPPPIDPRFSPAFQRGFDPASAAEQNPASQGAASSTADGRGVLSPPSVLGGTPAHRAPAAPPQALAVQPPAFAPGAGINGPAAPAAASANPAFPSAVETVDPAAVTVISDEFEGVEAARRNPFLVVLAIVAVVLVALGIWLFMRSGAAFNSTEIKSQGDYMTLTATIETAPFIALLGVATAIGVLFVFASRWRKRR
jgi:hypothetical protein